MMTPAALFNNSIFGFIIRSLQVFFALLTWALAADGIANFTTSGGLVWLLIAGLISFIYVIVIVILSAFVPGAIVPGAVFILEVFCALANFTGFIAAAAIIGSGSCDSTYLVGWIVYGFDSSSCRASKAAVAFGAFNWALFTFTATIFLFYAVFTLGTTNVWKTGNSINKPCLVASTTTADVADGDEETKVGDATTEDHADPDALTSEPKDSPVS